MLGCCKPWSRSCHQTSCWQEVSEIHGTVSSLWVSAAAAVETHGPLSDPSISFLDMGRKISEHTGEKLEVQFLLQWISVLIQRFNSVLLHETFPVEDDTDTNHSSLFLILVFYPRDLYLLPRGTKNNNICTARSAELIAIWTRTLTLSVRIHLSTIIRSNSLRWSCHGAGSSAFWGTLWL